MIGEIQKSDLDSKAELLQGTFVGLFSGRLAPRDASAQLDDAWDGVRRFKVSADGKVGTFCEGSAKLAYASQVAGFCALVLAETDEGPYELLLKLVDNDEPNFQIIGAEPDKTLIAV